MISSTVLAALVAGSLGSAPPGVASCAAAASAPPAPESETDIRAQERRWASSVSQGGEAAFLQATTTEDFSAILEGKVLTRSALIAEAEARRAGTAADELETINIRVFGSVAVAEGTEIWSDRGRRTRLVWADLWSHCDGRWRLRTSTSLAIPMPVASAPPH